MGALAQEVADPYPHESRIDALRAIQDAVPPQTYSPYEREYTRGESPHHQLASRLSERHSHGSSIPLAAGAATPGTVTPSGSPEPRSSRFSGRSIPLDDYGPSQSYLMANPNYQDSPYQDSSLSYNPAVSEASINPINILDDGDDGFMPEPQRKSVLHITRTRSNEQVGHGTAGAATAAGSAGILGGLFGRRAKKQTASGTYDPVTSGGQGLSEKSEWLARQTRGANKMRWTVGIVIGAVMLIAITAGVIGGVLGSHASKSSSAASSNQSTNNAGSDTAANGDLDKNSAEIQALMNNKNLHKVFPGIDYTPWGTQYPLCLTYPPSQNNVTRDMAVLSQLTNTVRLYGTDCNTTEMVLHAIDRLELTDMNVWLGVWIDTNQTTTTRQLNQMYKVLQDVKDLSVFKGAIVGNEALYRAGLDKAQSEQQLIDILTGVKSKFKSLGYNLPVATSDLGDNWNAQLVDVVDYVMSNIHPFFAGVTADVAAAWTWDFWQTHDVVLTESLPNVKQIISETGWPSGGGQDCGGSTGDCAPGQNGSVASVDGMNTFMDTWVCQALANGTDYFW